MIKIRNKEMFGGKGELSNFRFIGEAITMKNFLRTKRTQIFFALLIIFTLHTQAFTHLAFARSSGSGEMGEFETEKFLTNVGIGLAASYVGDAISNGLGASATGGVFFAGGGYNSATGEAFAGFNGAISNWSNAGTLASSYSSAVALNQLGAGVNYLGHQQGWENSEITFTSSVVQGAVSGGVINPAASTSSLVAGTIGGVTEGAILANNVDGNNKIKPWVSAAAGVAGSFARGTASAAIDEVIPRRGVETVMSLPKGEKGYIRGENNQLYDFDGNMKPVPGWKRDSITGEWSGPQRSIPIKAASFNDAISHGAVSALSAIPSRAVSMGVYNITKDMDREDAFMTRQAFRGVYSAVGSAYEYGIRDPILEENGLGNYVGYNGTTVIPVERESQLIFEVPQHIK